MGVAKFSSDKRIPFKIRWYHPGGEKEEMWGSVVHYDDIDEPNTDGLPGLYLIHSDGTKWRIDATEEGLRILQSGRVGGGLIVKQNGKEVEMINLNKDYTNRLLNAKSWTISAFIEAISKLGETFDESEKEDS